MPGEVFVHRNVANIVVQTDLNCQSVIQFAVDVLKVKHIMVVGHYGCGGVRAALDGSQHGLIDNWLSSLQDIHAVHREELSRLSGEDRVDLMCELNVKAQVMNVCRTRIVQNAWARGQILNVHGWIYSVRDGLLKDLHATISQTDEIDPVYKIAPLKTPGAATE
jgi:carbonic anhydrase